MTLNTDTTEILATIHEEGRTRYRYDAAVDNAFGAINDAGEGYPVGDDGDTDIAAVTEAGDYLGTTRQDVAVYRNDTGLTLVADAGGLWAVDVEVA